MIRVNSNHVIAGLSILALSLSFSVGPAFCEGSEGESEHSAFVWGRTENGFSDSQKESPQVNIGSGNETGIGLQGSDAKSENNAVNMGGGSENSAFGSMQGGTWDPSNSESGSGLLNLGWIPSPLDSPQQIAKELGEKDTSGGGSESGGMATAGPPEEHTYNYYVQNYK